MRAGVPVSNYAITLTAADGTATLLAGRRGVSVDGHLQVTARDRLAQEDVRHLVWSGPAALLLANESTPALPVTAEDREAVIEIDYAVSERPQGSVTIDCGEGCDRAYDLMPEMNLAEAKGWRTLRIPLGSLPPPADRAPSTIR